MNKKELLAQIQTWAQQMEHQKIIDAILAMPESERDYVFTCLLAREYNVMKRYDEARELLESVRSEGKNDPNWFFHYGFSLFNVARFAEAKGAFQRVLQAAPNHPNVAALIKGCDANLEKEAAIRAYGTGEDLDEDKALEFILNAQLHNRFEAKDEVKEDHIYIPAWNVRIYPDITNLEADAVAITFNIECPDWDRDIIEVSAAKGKNPANAITIACTSFMLSVMSAVTHLCQEKNSVSFETEFAGSKHRWKAYRGNLLAGGDAQNDHEFNMYWDVLKDELPKRIGNQKLVYVKIYATRNGSEIKVDCRINNVRINSISNAVGHVAETWNCPGYGVHRQCFIFRQDEATTVPYPHFVEDIEDYTREVMKLFHTAKSREDVDAMYSKVLELCGDKTLARELMLYIPMVASENAFRQLTLPETIDYNIKGEKTSIFRSQSAAYHTIQSAVLWALQHKVFGEETEALYQTLIAASPLTLFLRKTGGKVPEGAGVGFTFNVEDDFEIR